jgi:hypothetical protein
VINGVDTPTMNHRRRLPFTLASLLLGLAGAAATAGAHANTTTSDNWSGYAAHGKAQTFRSASATWQEPSTACAAGSATYSAFWVGLGGYSLSADALEQVGTEYDCSKAGRAELSAWYELVPAASRTIRMRVDAGDRIHASVTVIGERVRITLTDRTRHRSFTRTIVDHTIDITSAEWIAEAPSDCGDSSSRCSTLALADFGSVGFTGAHATTTTGRTRAISSDLWDTTKLLLGSSGASRFVSESSSSPTSTPSALSSGGSAFTVSYTGTTPSGAVRIGTSAQFPFARTGLSL